MITVRDFAALLIVILATAWIGEKAFADSAADGGDCNLPPEPFGTLTYAYDAGISREIAPAVPTEVSDPARFATTYVYDPVSNLVMTSPTGHMPIDGYRYDAANNVITSNLPAVQTGAYDTNSNLVTSMDHTTTTMGGVTSTIYDEMGSSRDTLTPPGASTGITTRYQYDTNGNVLSHTAPNMMGYQTRYDDSSTNGTASLTDPLGRVTSYQYDSVGNRMSYTAPNASSLPTQYQYDSMDRQVREADPLGNVTSYQYDSTNNRMSTTVDTSPELTTTTVYDAVDRSVKETDPLGIVTQYQYDSTGNLTHTRDVDPSTHITTNSYDSMNNITSSTDANGNTTSYQYDATNNLIRQTDAFGDVTSTDSYDATGSTTDPLGNLTSYTFDAVYDYNEIAGGLGGPMFTYTYDMTDIISSGGITTTYTYDSLGNLSPLPDWSPFLGDYLYDSTYSFASTSGLSQTGGIQANYLVSYVPLPAASLGGAALMALLAFAGRSRILRHFFAR